MTCPSCGAQTSGRFCGSCGTAVRTDTPTVRLMLDATTIPDFREGRRCALRFAVVTEPAATALDLTVRTTAFAEALVDRATGHRDGPVRLAVGFVPDTPGHHELTGQLSARVGDMDHVWELEAVDLFIGDRSAPVTVDLSSLRVATFDGAGFGAEKGRMLGDGDWRELALTPRAAHTEAPTLTTRRRAYHLGQVLARGDVATLYAASYTQRGKRQEVVLKLADDADDNDLLSVEARVLRTLSAEPSPQRKHLPRLVDQLVHEGRAGLVLERCDGVDLVTLRERYPDGIDPRHVIWIGRRALSLLGLAHSKGFLHGNLEPSHVFVRPHDHNVWLLDWTGAVEGPDGGFTFLNPPWSAPEVEARGRPRPASDFHALGQSLAFVLGAEPGGAIPETVPAELRDAVDRFRAPSALRRPTDAWEEYHALDRLRGKLWGRHQFIELEV